VKNVSNATIAVRDLRTTNEGFVPTGANPQVLINLKNQKIAGRDAGVLVLDFECRGTNVPPRLHLAWWGDGQPAPPPTPFLGMHGQSGRLVVPLDAYPRWITMALVDGITVDIAGGQSCSAIAFGNVELMQRKSVLEYEKERHRQ
jgi:hypothetical protein